MKTSHYLFTIIIPVWNSYKYLERCMESVISQTFKDFEIVIIDDGSTDGSKAVYDYYTNGYDNINCYYIDHKGVSFARNIGIEKAKGKYLLFFDSDDYVAPNCLEILSKYVREDYDVINYGHIVHSYKNNILISEKVKTSDEIYVIYNTTWNKEIRKYWNSDIGKLPVWDKVFKKSLIVENKIRFNNDQVVLEDFTFVLKSFSAAKTVLIIKEPLYFFRRNLEDSVYNKRGIYLVDSINTAMQEFNFFCMTKVISEDVYPELRKFVFDWYMSSVWTIKNKNVSYSDSRSILKELFEKKLFISTIKQCGGKKIKFILFLIKINMLSIATLCIKKIY